MSASPKIQIAQQVDLYIKGKLSDQEIDALWAEFVKNPSLLEDLELEVGVKKLIEEQAIKKESSSSRKQVIHALPNWTWYISAVAAIVFVALLQLFQVETPTKMEQFVVSTISPDQIETSNGVRAKDMRISSADSLLNLGFQASVTGNYNRALRLYDEVISTFDEEPYGSKAYLNKGIILYNSSDYEAAISAFEEALSRAANNRMISEKAYWYLGNAFVNINQLEKAQTAVAKAYSLDGVFRAPAFRLLQKINYDLGKVDYEDFDNQN